MYHFFLIFASKHRLLVLSGTASAMWFLHIHTDCLLGKHKKNINDFTRFVPKYLRLDEKIFVLHGRVFVIISHAQMIGEGRWGVCVHLSSLYKIAVCNDFFIFTINNP